MRKAILAAFLLLLPWVAQAQLSPNTMHMYTRNIATLTGVVDDSYKIEVDVPSWASSVIVHGNVTNCSSCLASVTLQLYYPRQTFYTAPMYVNVLPAFSTNGWVSGLVAPVGYLESALNTDRGPLVTGTTLVFVNHSAGSFDIDLWIRYLE